MIEGSYSLFAAALSSLESLHTPVSVKQWEEQELRWAWNWLHKACRRVDILQGWLGSGQVGWFHFTRIVFSSPGFKQQDSSLPKNYRKKTKRKKEEEEGIKKIMLLGCLGIITARDSGSDLASNHHEMACSESK